MSKLQYHSCIYLTNISLCQCVFDQKTDRTWSAKRHRFHDLPAKCWVTPTKMMLCLRYLWELGRERVEDKSLHWVLKCFLWLPIHTCQSSKRNYDILWKDWVFAWPAMARWLKSQWHQFMSKHKSKMPSLTRLTCFKG